MTIQLRSIAASAALSANTSMQSTMPVSVPSTSSSSSSSSLQSGGSRSAFQAPSQNRRQVKRPSAPTPSHPQQVSRFNSIFFNFSIFPSPFQVSFLSILKYYCLQVVVGTAPAHLVTVRNPPMMPNHQAGQEPHHPLQLHRSGGETYIVGSSHGASTSRVCGHQLLVKPKLLT